MQTAALLYLFNLEIYLRALNKHAVYTKIIKLLPSVDQPLKRRKQSVYSVSFFSSISLVSSGGNNKDKFYGGHSFPQFYIKSLQKTGVSVMKDFLSSLQNLNSEVNWQLTLNSEEKNVPPHSVLGDSGWRGREAPSLWGRRCCLIKPLERQWETEQAMNQDFASSYFNAWLSSFLSDLRKGTAT